MWAGWFRLVGAHIKVYFLNVRRLVSAQNSEERKPVCKYSFGCTGCVFDLSEVNELSSRRLQYCVLEMYFF